ncbi:MAG: PEP-CTERM sorting domain-containing protein [Verrucomicrobiota bacterium]
MKKHIAALAAFISGMTASQAAISMADDVLFVVGNGANRATLVIDFNDGTTTESFAWGFRWDGVASGADMILAVVGADPNLSMTSFGDGASGFFITEISFFDGTTSHSEAGGTFATFPDDFVSWGYYLAGGTAGDSNGDDPGGIPTPVPNGGNALPGSWVSSPTGASLDSLGESGRILEDGAWDAWSFGPNEDSPSFAHTQPPGPEAPTAAIPEPSVMGLFALGLATFLVRRRRL